MRQYQALVFVTMAACSGEVSIGSCKTGGGGSGGLDRAKLLAGVETFVTEWATPPRAVRCPEHLQWIDGKTFECQVDLAGGTVSVTVLMRADYAGGVVWTEPVATGPHLEAAIVASLARDDTLDVEAVDCGDQILFERPDSTVTCTSVRGPAGTVTASMTVDDENTATFDTTFHRAAP